MNQNAVAVKTTAQFQLDQRVLDGATSFTTDEIAHIVESAASFLRISNLDLTAIVAELETSFRTRIGAERILEGEGENWEPWLNQRKADIRWAFWNRYEQYLLMTKGWPSVTTRKLDETTDTILSLLTDPEREGPWDRRGMVVGDVQSGKTSNYIGLIAKAADAGYKVIVVLAGFHKSLRSQTQIRLEEGFLGFDRGASGPGARIPVGVGQIDPMVHAHSITTRADDGDFKAQVARQFSIAPGGLPLLFVVKKNYSVLNNLLNWVEFAANARDERGRPYVKDVPLLVVDDEADQGSVDTNEQGFDEEGQPDREHDPTAINRRIRRLLHLFDKSAYVGYTATPFANIFIHENGATAEEGEDLFPRSFIISLPTPSDHVGPSRIFGYQTDDGLELPGLPIIRTVTDYLPLERGAESDDLGWIPSGHRKDHVPRYRGEPQLPPSVREAIRSFVLVCAARDARGQTTEHNSMLIHVTRFTAVQGHVAEQVAAELRDIQRRLRLGDGDSPDAVLVELRQLWEADFVPTSRAVFLREPGKRGDVHAWDEIMPFVASAALAIQVRQINGLAGEVLDYKTHEQNGLNVIAIGGDKLSRGLTLEGLSVSYFLRASRMYDTLMQMGRWFGYRPSYLDLCRLYTTPSMTEWFSHIAQASDELRDDFNRMAASGGSPRAFGHRVKSHPLMMVTSQVKMRNGVRINISYQGAISETIDFWRDRRSLIVNWEAGDKLIKYIEGRGLERKEKAGGGKGFLWKEVPAGGVIEFLTAFQEHEASRKVRTRLLADYIRKENGDQRLCQWTVLVAGGASAARETLGNTTVNLVERSWYLAGADAAKWSQKSDLMSRNHFRIRRLVNPPDETVDLTQAQLERARALTIADWEEEGRTRRRPDRPSGPRIRDVRDNSAGLLILYPLDGSDSSTAGIEGTEKVQADAVDVPVLGFAISFPAVDLERASKVEYIVNNVYFAQEVLGESGLED